VNAATGFVPLGTIGINPTGGDFRSEAGNAINPAPDVSGARSLLQAAGVTGGNIRLTYRDAPAQKNETAVAEYIAEVWRSLGFNVTLEAVRGRPFNDAVFGLDYDVILHDFQAPGVCAFSVLAPFALPFSGGAGTYDRDGGNWIPAPYYTGFNSERYDALMEEIFMIVDNRARNERLVAAEIMLAEYMPIAPLFFNTSINISDARLTGITYSRFGFPVFTRTDLRNHLEYTTTVAPRTTAAPAP
jgi:oligopeptide transport system substrate-binding protein